MNKNIIQLIRSLKEGQFDGGTLVEYRLGTGFSEERIRTEIETASIEEQGATFKGTNTSLTVRNIGDLLVHKQDGVFYVSVTHMPKYAIAPEGTEIPREAPIEKIMLGLSMP